MYNIVNMGSNKEKLNIYRLFISALTSVWQNYDLICKWVHHLPSLFLLGIFLFFLSWISNFLGKHVRIWTQFLLFPIHCFHPCTNSDLTNTILTILFCFQQSSTLQNWMLISTPLSAWINILLLFLV